jgi:hypothetical protein
MRLGSLLAILAVTTAPLAGDQGAATNVIWIYDCSQSHHDTLAPTYPKAFGAMTRPMDELTKAVADNLGEVTAVRILSFGSGLRVSPGWGRTRAELATSLDCGDTKMGPSPMWDAVYRAAELLEERSGRREILMLTDGRSSANERGFQQALDKAKQAGVRVNIGLPRTELFRSSRAPNVLNANRAGDPAERLKQLADATGGRYMEHSVSGLTSFVADVARSWQK